MSNTARKQQSAAPTRKVIAGAVAGALSSILVFVMNAYILKGSTPIPARPTVG